MWTPFAQRCSIWIEETLGDAGGGNLAQVTTLCENEAYGRYRPGRTHTNHGRCGDGDWQQYLTGTQPRISYVNLSSRRLSRSLCIGTELGPACCGDGGDPGTPQSPHCKYPADQTGVIWPTTSGQQGDQPYCDPQCADQYEQM